LASAGQRDVRVGIRDAVYLYEVQIRRGRLCSATRSSSDGSFERGEFVLAALLGVSAGRFVIEPDASACRADFDGTPAEILKGPVERARSSLNSISAGALVGVTRVQIAGQMIDGYLSCTPEPARGLLQKVMAGASPRELITSGSVAPRLLEAVLSDVARRGGITAIERVGDEPSPLRGSLTAAAALSPIAPKVLVATPVPPRIEEQVSADDAGWFSLQVESASPAAVAEHVEPAPISEPAITAPRFDVSKIAPPVAEKPKALPFSSEVTPSVDRLWDTITEGVFTDSTLQGVGVTLPAVGGPKPELAEPVPVAPAKSEPPLAPKPATTPQPPRPAPSAERADDSDALARALTADSPIAPAVAPHATQVMTAVSIPVSTASTTTVQLPDAPLSASEPSRPTLTSEGAPDSAVKRASKAKTEPRSGPPVVAATAKSKQTSNSGAWLVKALLAFAVSYAIVSYYRASVMRPGDDRVPEPAPASSQ
jgi:hypothetical protein